MSQPPESRDSDAVGPGALRWDSEMSDGPLRQTVVMPHVELAEEPPKSRADRLADAERLVGRVIGKRYRLVAMIAAGGMGAIFRGEHVRMRHRVAIKMLLAGSDVRADLVERFEREAIAGARVRHPNVVAATDFGHDDDGNHFLVLELVQGKTLAEIIDEGPLATSEAVRIARQLAAALEAVHEKGIVHRDVKPKNVVVSDEDGQVKLLDFGFAKIDVDRLSVVTAEGNSGASELTQAGMVLGTVGYMAPEVARGMAALDARADLYALGLILYELLTGKHPFEAPTRAELFAAQCCDPPPSFAERAPEVRVPPGLEAVVMTLLAKRPEERFQSATAVMAALDAAVGDTAAAAEGPSAAEAPLVSEPARLRDLPASASLEDLQEAREARAPESLPESLQEPRPEPSPPARAAKLGAANDEAPAMGKGGFTADRLLAAMKRPQNAALILAPLVLLTLALVIAFSGSDSSEGSPSLREERAGKPDATTTEEARAEKPTRAASQVDRMAAERWRAKLERAHATKHWLGGAEAALALAEIDPGAFSDPELRGILAAVAVGVAAGKAEHADPLFDALENDLGDAGLEVLWEVVRSKGGTEAQRRASEILRSPAVIERAPAALLIALDLRTKPCADRASLFERAAEVGDARVLQELQILAHAPCRNERDACCFRKHSGLRDAIAALSARLAP